MNAGHAHARYRELLYQHGHGYPFWIPETNDALSKEQKAEGVRLGDVGILTDDGGFEYLWNVHLPADHPYNKSRVPPNFTPLEALNETLDVRRIDAFYPENTAISSSSVKKCEIKLEAQLQPAIVAGVVSGGASFEFSAEGNSGAILTLPRGGVRADAVKRNLYQKYAAAHAESWYRYINQELQLDVQSGALYLVTGTDKCSSWGVASFAKPRGSSSLTLKFVTSSIANTDLSVKNSWTADFGLEHRAKVVDASELSQCVFARGFVISVRDHLWAQICGMSVRTTSLYGANSRSSFVSSSRPFSRGADSSSIVDVQPSPDYSPKKNPGALLGEEFLRSNEDALFAIVHDEDWIESTRNRLRTRDLESSFLENFIGHAAAHSRTAVVNGICTVVETDVVTPSVTPVSDVPLAWDDVKVATVAEALLHVQQHVSSQPTQVTHTAIAQPEVVPASPDVRSRLFALIIGINVHEHAGSTFHNLKGAVADADDMCDFLTSTLAVDPSHIRNLRDHQATRDGIIDAFAALTSDDRIHRDDAIVIFYAGHGSQAAAPSDWETGGRDARIEMIIPHNFFPATTSNRKQQGILDITLSALLTKLAEQKGDNITVILDSCHSGSSTRDPLEIGVLSRGITLPDNYTILPSLEDDGSRHATVAFGHESSGLSSHVLLAACSRMESAQECNGRGFFTQALLTLLRDANVRNMTYRAVIEELPELPFQHPQCEGKNSARALFDGKAPGRSLALYPVKVTKTADEVKSFSLGGGQIQGITEGAEFDVLATRDFNAQPLCRLVVTVTHACSADLAPVPGSVEHDIPQPAWALQATVGKRVDLVVALSPAHAFLNVLKIAAEMNQRPNHHAIRFVDPDVMHELELHVDGDRVLVIVADRLCTDAGLTQLPNTVSVNDAPAVYAVIEAAADFFFHLRRSNPAAPLAGKVILEAFELQARYDAKRDVFTVTPSSSNLVTGGLMQLAISKEGPMYGFKLTSSWPCDLYVWVFMFDVSNLSVVTLYKPTFSKTHPDPSLPGRGSLTLGYGSGGVEPREFFLREGADVDVEYLKVYVSSEAVDLSNIAQDSPFGPGQRKMMVRKVVQLPLWDTILVPIVQKAVV
ncbi:hypothetical protein EXIGLDRAFT_718838 [Exidia glandulosa HHB12029]|uniref:Peptidase C14 caspase domain-containing protein n=1 Tax=Exidia glandulosa HHB12029 TaxID=1314781 RepID=A0A165HG22_EXIGL|nr:hypothetical protein EXIGLDRAFT_718838 [Exidia glandulosa HHB12029]